MERIFNKKDVIQDLINIGVEAKNAVDFVERIFGHNESLLEDGYTVALSTYDFTDGSVSFSNCMSNIESNVDALNTYFNKLYSLCGEGALTKVLRPLIKAQTNAVVKPIYTDKKSVLIIDVFKQLATSGEIDSDVVHKIKSNLAKFEAKSNKNNPNLKPDKIIAATGSSISAQLVEYKPTEGVVDYLSGSKEDVSKVPPNTAKKFALALKEYIGEKWRLDLQVAKDDWHHPSKPKSTRTVMQENLGFAVEHVMQESISNRVHTILGKDIIEFWGIKANILKTKDGKIEIPGFEMDGYFQEKREGEELRIILSVKSSAHAFSISRDHRHLACLTAHAEMNPTGLACMDSNTGRDISVSSAAGGLDAIRRMAGRKYIYLKAAATDIIPVPTSEELAKIDFTACLEIGKDNKYSAPRPTEVVAINLGKANEISGYVEWETAMMPVFEELWKWDECRDILNIALTDSTREALKEKSIPAWNLEKCMELQDYYAEFATICNAILKRFGIVAMESDLYRMVSQFFQTIPTQCQPSSQFNTDITHGVKYSTLDAKVGAILDRLDLDGSNNDLKYIFNELFYCAYEGNDSFLKFCLEIGTLTGLGDLSEKFNTGLFNKEDLAGKADDEQIKARIEKFISETFLSKCNEYLGIEHSTHKVADPKGTAAHSKPGYS